LSFFRSPYVFSPFGVDVIAQPHAALQSFIAATVLSPLTIIEAANVLLFASVFLISLCAYALVVELTRNMRTALMAGVVFAGSTFVAERLTGNVDVLNAWALPLAALLFQRALASGGVVPAVLAGLVMSLSGYGGGGYIGLMAFFAVLYAALWSARRQGGETMWIAIQALTIAVATVAVVSLPLIVQWFRVIVAGRHSIADAVAAVLPSGVVVIAAAWIGVAPLVARRRYPLVSLLVIAAAVGVMVALVPAWRLSFTRLDRPAVYEQLATITDDGAVIDLPFDFTDPRALYDATTHGHPLVGGWAERIQPDVASAYQSMPVIGNLLRLSNGGEAVDDGGARSLPFKYLVLDKRRASPELVDYIKSALDMDLIASADGKELYAVQGSKPPTLRASA
jgi:hypothetical protein